MTETLVIGRNAYKVEWRHDFKPMHALVIADSADSAADAIEETQSQIDDSIDIERIGTIHGYSGALPYVVCLGPAQR